MTTAKSVPARGRSASGRPDVRRALHRYIEREGDIVYAAPYRATEADLHVVVLNAEPSVLQRWLDAELGEMVSTEIGCVGSASELRFHCSADWLVLIYASMRALRSIDDAVGQRGRVGAYELSVWVPIVLEQEIGGAPSYEQAWFMPVVYTSPAAAVVTGREVYGYPKLPAYLRRTDSDVPCAVEIGEHARSDHRTRMLQTTINTRNTGDAERAAAEQTWRSLLIQKYLANLPIVFRKQAGFESEGCAAYSAVIETRVPINSLGSVRPLDLAVDVRHIERCASGPLPLDSVAPSKLPEDHLGKLRAVGNELIIQLGLQGSDVQAALEVRGCTLDIQRGRELWVAARPIPYRKVREVPGNEALRTPTDNVARRFDDLEGCAVEVYAAHARPGAIAALLERHFPDTCDPRPRARKDATFVLLVLTRQQRGRELLAAEFGVWVPVCCDEEDAWYVPYLFRAPGTAVLDARERYGHPCQDAFIEFPEDERAARWVELRQPQWMSGELVWLPGRGIRFEPIDGEGSAPPDGAVSQIETFLTEQKIVALHQVRHVTTSDRAAFSRVRRSVRRFEAEPQVAEPGPWCKLVLPEHLRFGRLIDLDGSRSSVRTFRWPNVRITTAPDWTTAP